MQTTASSFRGKLREIHQSRAAALDDAALIAAIPAAGLTDAPALAAEAGSRKLASAVPALEGLCNRFTGFGADRPVPVLARFDSRHDHGVGVDSRGDIYAGLTTERSVDKFVRKG